MRFTETRAALRGLLAGRIGCEPAQVLFASGPHGKPHIELASGAAPLFNLSHSGAHALIVLGNARMVSEVGVDIEECKADVDIEAVSSLAFTGREVCELHKVRDAADRLHALYGRWVAKEAVLKAVGVGVAEHLKSIGIHRDAQGRLVLEYAVPEWTNFQAVALDAPPGYAAALAWRAKEST